MIDEYTEATRVSSEQRDDGLTRIGGYTICMEGLAAGRTSRGVARRVPVPREHVEIAKDFLKQCRKIKAVHWTTCPINGVLKHDIERWAGRYICRGAVIIAALELGITIVPIPQSDDDTSCLFYEPPIAAVIGINSRDVQLIMQWV
jgi:hypothetical protein